MKPDDYGWIDASRNLPLTEVPVLVYGKGWSGMAVAQLSHGFQGIDGNKYPDIGKVCWRTLRGMPIPEPGNVGSRPVTHWRYLPPAPIL